MVVAVVLVVVKLVVVVSFVVTRATGNYVVHARSIGSEVAAVLVAMPIVVLVLLVLLVRVLVALLVLVVAAMIVVVVGGGGGSNPAALTGVYASMACLTSRKSLCTQRNRHGPALSGRPCCMLIRA